MRHAKTMQTTAALAAAAGTSLAVLTLTAGQARADGLDLERITLYRSGVGSFELRGEVLDDADVALRFETGDINDMLKSMVVLDLSGQGTVEAVGYGSKEPLSRRLASFAIDVNQASSLEGLLRQLRGAPIAVETMDGDQEGTVLGVEQRTRIIQDGKTAVDRFLNLLTTSGARSIDLLDVRNLRILDAQLRQELELALEALAEQRSENVKQVELRFRGAGRRDVAVAYVQETPVWKTSYRLVLPDETGRDPTLQGWAIVENTTDEDWQDVRLSLVSGRPVSFVMDLYEPLYLDRPELPAPVERGVRPKVYAQGVNERAPARASGGRKFSAMPATDARAGVAFESAEVNETIASAELQRYSPAARATAEEAGEVFQYTLDAPVTIERQRSAMLPILSEAVAGRRVSIYTATDGGAHPMRGVQLSNDSGLKLIPGPISVYDGGAYAGDAQIGHVGPGDDALLAYSVDLDVRVDPQTEHDHAVRSVRIVDGSLVRRVESRMTTTYRIDNRDERRDRVVIIEHPRRGGGWEIVKPEPTESGPGWRRFETQIKPGHEKTLRVEERWVRSETVGLINANPAELLIFNRDGRVSKAVVEAVQQAQQLKARANETRQGLAALDRERGEIDAEQRRIRQNMGAVDRTSSLYKRYVTKLDEQESRLEAIAGELEQARGELHRRESALREYLRGLNVH